MRLFDLLAIVLVLVAGLSYVNFRFLRLPTTIGLMALTLGLSVGVIVIGQVAPGLESQAKALVERLDFDEVLLHGMLGFLLFAGALHVNVNELARWKTPIAVLATMGVLISTVIIGGVLAFLLPLFGIPARPIWCFVFGALISPTDPIAVLALLKQLGAPKPLEIKIAGESLFNDGVGVVVFLGLLQIAAGEHGFDPGHLTALFFKEAVGGAVFGLAAGWLTYRLLKSVDNYQVEVMLSLALVAGGYALAEHWHLSAPIAMVVAGLLIGNHGRSFAMSPTTVEHLDLFWELIDEILNAVLFVLIGLEVLIVTFSARYLLAGVAAIGIVLLARLIAVAVPISFLRRYRTFEPGTARILTWGGLRGGISVALALALPATVGGEIVPEREVILVLTYTVVVFSILVQGLTIGPLIRRWLAAAPHQMPTASTAATAFPTNPTDG